MSATDSQIETRMQTTLNSHEESLDQSMLALESQLEAQEGKLEVLSSQMQELTSEVQSMCKILEKMILGFQNNEGRQHISDSKSWEEHLSNLNEKIVKINGTEIRNPRASFLVSHFKEEEHGVDETTTQESRRDLARHVATTVTVPGERLDVKGKISSDSNFNRHCSPPGSTHPSVGPISHTICLPRYITTSGRLVLKPYGPPKLIADPNRIANQHLTKQEDEDDVSDLKSNSSYIGKTPTPYFESLNKTYHHDHQDEGSCLTENLKEELSVPAFSVRSIDRLIQFYKPTCKIKPSDIFSELPTNHVENFGLNNRIHKFLSKSRCNHCFSSLGIVNCQPLKLVERLLCPGCYNEGPCVAGNSSIDFMKDDTTKAYRDLEAIIGTNQGTLLLLEAMKFFTENEIEIAEQKLNTISKGKSKLFQELVSCPVKKVRKLPASMDAGMSVFVLEVKSISIIPTPSDLCTRSEGGASVVWPREAIGKALSLTKEEKHITALVDERLHINLKNQVTVDDVSCNVLAPNAKYMIFDHSEGKFCIAGCLSFALWGAYTRKLLKVVNVDGKIETLSVVQNFKMEEDTKMKIESGPKREEKQGLFQHSHNAISGADDAV